MTRPCPHFLAYASVTSSLVIEMLVKPINRKSFSIRDADQAPPTQVLAMWGSAIHSAGSCFLVVMSEIATRPPGFSTRKISR